MQKGFQTLFTETIFTETWKQETSHFGFDLQL